MLELFLVTESGLMDVRRTGRQEKGNRLVYSEPNLWAGSSEPFLLLIHQLALYHQGSERTNDTHGSRVLETWEKPFLCRGLMQSSHDSALMTPCASTHPRQRCPTSPASQNGFCLLPPASETLTLGHCRERLPPFLPVAAPASQTS